MSGSIRALEKHLLHDVGRAIADFKLIEDGDRVLVALSGGKDSYTLLHLLRLLQQRAPVKFEILPFHLDQGHPNAPVEAIREYLTRERLNFRVERVDTYSIVKEKVPPGAITCALCSRLRRGIIYTWAPKYGCNKIALGHHRDDAIETLLLNMLFSGRLRGMPPRLRSADARNIVIRPLIFAAEERIAEYAREMRFPVVPCVLCSMQESAQRPWVKALLANLDRQRPGLKSRLVAALGNVDETTLLDRRLLDDEIPVVEDEAAE